MKMLMIICPENRQQEVRELIAKHNVHSYSEIPINPRVIWKSMLPALTRLGT